MNNIPSTTSASASAQGYRGSTVGDRQQFDAPGPEAGRNSPQPSMGEKETDPEKQFKDLCKTGPVS